MTTLYIFISIFILLWAYLMKVIPQTRHSHYIIYLCFYFYFTMSVPDEGYSTNMSFILHYKSGITFIRYAHSTIEIETKIYNVVRMTCLWNNLHKVPDEGYSTNTSFALHYISSFLFSFYYERTWWRLFRKHVIHTTLAIFVSIFIANDVFVE
jgi:hypothetical protein